jgi:PAS domain S-box-containing protein
MSRTSTMLAASIDEPAQPALSPQAGRMVRTLLDHASDAILIQDLDSGLIVDVNGRAEALYGYSRAEFRSFPADWDLRTPEEVAAGASLFTLHQQGAPIPERPRWHRRKDGTAIPVEVTVSRLEVDGRALLIAAVRDISARLRAERAQRFLADAGAALAASLDYDRTLTRIAELAVPEIGDWCVVFIREDDGRYRRVALTCAPSEPPALYEELVRSLPAEPADPRTLPIQIRSSGPLLVEQIDRAFLISAARDAQAAEFLASLGLISLIAVGMYAHGKPFGLIVLGTARSGRRFGAWDLQLATDLAGRAALSVENARLYEEVAERRRQLQDLVSRLLVGQEEERRRVAYEVHDGIAQVAASAHQHLQAYAARHQDADAGERAELDQALALARLTVREARQIVDRLRPTVLDDFGLATALRHEVEGLRALDWDVTYVHNLQADRLPAAVETTLFRVAQEVIADAHRHTDARRLAVRLERDAGCIVLDMRGWGRGVDVASPDASQGPSERLELTGMTERVRLLSGRCSVESSPVEGIRVVVEVPLAAEASPVKSW